MDKIACQKVFPACSKQNRAFYKRHVQGEHRATKTTNHVGNFQEVLYHKVLDKKIKKHPGKKRLKLVEGQKSYIAKNVQVKEFGSHKTGRLEESLSFEIAGRDGPAGGVVPEHLHRSFRSLKAKEEKEKGTLLCEGTEQVQSQGGSVYTLASTPQPYNGYQEEVFAEERRSDTDFFLQGEPNWMDSTNPTDFENNFPALN